ncbi:MAG: hypothetical protein WB492_11530 [Christiangramia sp.]
MNIKFASFCFIAAIAFTSCQPDANSENPEEVLAIQNSLKEKKHDVNKIHEPPLAGGVDGGFRLHEPGFFRGALADCDTYVHYDGGEDLMVIEDAPQSYHGEAELNTIEVNDRFNFCGTLLVDDEVKINYAGVFNLGGEMMVENNVTIIYGGHLVVEGNVVIEGDLVLRKGATLKFLGDHSTIEVLGKAKISQKAIIEGEFKDVSEKIK